jgi:large subunit ribosomal protein L16
MHIPRKTKYKKSHKGKKYNNLNSILGLQKFTFGNVGLKATTFGILTEKNLEILKIFLRKSIKKTGKVFVNIVADTPITRKPAEVRMGKGKGSVSFWARKIKIGDTVCELESTLNRNVLLNILSKVKAKLPFKTKIFLN